jgi:hypothetical protein
MLSHRHLALLVATLTSVVSLGGCQTARRYSAASAPVGSASLQVAARETPPQADEPPFLRGPAEPVPLASVDEPQSREFRSQDRNDPALPLPAEDDAEDETADDAPAFPRIGRRSNPDGARPDRGTAAVTRDPLPLVDHAGRAENAGKNGRPVARLPLPITRRLPARSSPATAPQTAPYGSAARQFPVTEPVRLADPPTLYAPPTER